MRLPTPEGDGVIVGETVKGQWSRFLTWLLLRPVLCPRCGNGWPICTDQGPGGRYFLHEETCATYDWADDTCAECSFALGGQAQQEGRQ